MYYVPNTYDYVANYTDDDGNDQCNNPTDDDNDDDQFTHHDINDCSQLQHGE